MKEKKNIWEYYNELIKNKNSCNWDFVILTAANIEQAKIYKKEITQRIEQNQIPSNTNYLVIEDAEGKKIGSGGATLNVLKKIYDGLENKEDLKTKKILIIHSGGESKRIPQYSIYGKLFTPLPYVLPNGRNACIFDELLIKFCVVPSKMFPGVLCLSGDVLLEFNPFDIKLPNCDSVCISIKEKVDIGCNHGVFLVDKNGYVEEFLHKKSVEELKKYGATDKNNLVNIDTGVIFLSYTVVIDLILMVLKEEKDKFVNDTVKINLYGDIVYTFANNANWDKYKNQSTEVEKTEELLDCRRKLWNVLSKYKMKILNVYPGRFVHLGTTKEFLNVVSKEIDKHENWKRKINTNMQEKTDYTLNTVLFSGKSSVGKNSYIEYSYINENCNIGEKVIISNTKLKNIVIPDNICINTIKLNIGKYVTIIYSINDNLKQKEINKIRFLDTCLQDCINKYDINTSLIWNDENNSAWEANIFCVCDNEEQSVLSSLELYKIIHCKENIKNVEKYFSKQRINCKNCFNECDVEYMINRKEEIDIKVRTEQFIKGINNRKNLYLLVDELEKSSNLKKQIFDILNSVNDNIEYETRYRVYLALAFLTEKNKKLKLSNQYFMDLCYKEVRDMIVSKFEIPTFKTVKEKATIELPIRVNFAGGWTDTPPYCNENGGSVLNAAFKLNGKNPIKVHIEKIEENVIILESIDLKIRKEFKCINDLKNLENENDNFKIHKTALILTGIVQEGDKSINEVIARIGKGFIFSTNVKNIPKGSGLGTSSILAGACLKTLYDFLNISIDEKNLFNQVLVQEQLMGTGGGWQDQIGGLTKGIKMITTEPGIIQNFDINEINLSQKFIDEFNTRFILIYTGQQRVAKKLLQIIMNKYIASEEMIINILKEIKQMPIQMKQKLEQENLDGFSDLLNKHWELSKELDDGCTNSNIDKIFNVCDDLIQGKMICGAGGGGFLQVVLKKGKTKEMLDKKIKENFYNTDIKLYNINLVQ